MYEYSAPDVQMFPALRDPRKKDTPYNVASILLPCGVGGCATLLRIRIAVASDEDLREKALEVLPIAQAHAIQCDSKQHTMNGSVMRRATGFDAMFDEDWEIRGVDYP